jgi:hypothetical protein
MTNYEIKKEIAKAICEMNHYVNLDSDLWKAAQEDYQYWKAYLDAKLNDVFDWNSDMDQESNEWGDYHAQYDQ